CEDVAVIHDVRLEVNHRTLVKPGRDQVARVDVTACADFSDVVGRILIWRKLHFFRHHRGNCVGDFDLLVVGATQKPPQHLKTFVIKRELGFEVGSIYKKMQMILLDEGG